MSLAIWMVVLIITVGLTLPALAVICLFIPGPHRSLAPPPLEYPGHRYTCFCWLEPVRVVIVEDPLTGCAKYARRTNERLDHRNRLPSSRAEATKAGEAGQA